MKALTLTQPWATLVAIGAKRVETRGWYTRYRGPVAIHAARGFPPEARALCARWVFQDALWRANYMSAGELPLGAVLAIAELVECVPTNDQHRLTQLAPIGSDEEAFGDYTANRYAWVLQNVRRVPTPIAAKGALGLWEWSAP